jgi:NADH:ubiquinone reductase (non-electrogenic)
MASSSRALSRLAAPQLAARARSKLPATAPSVASIAGLTTSTSSARPSVLVARTPLAQQILSRQQLRRGYSDVAPETPKPQPKKRKLRVFRWLWRLTWVSALGGVAYTVYDGYQARHPEDQFNPDPSKKTLVILGKSIGRQLVNLSALWPNSSRGGGICTCIYR